MSRYLKTGLITYFLLNLVFVLLTGCTQKRPDGFPKIYPTAIVVTQESKPLAGATVILFPEDESLSRWAISAQTNDDGVATLATQGQYVGAPAGKFTVVITKEEIKYDKPPQQVGPDVSYGTGKVYSLVELKQTDQKTSPHKVTLEAKKNRVELDAGKAVRLLKGKLEN